MPSISKQQFKFFEAMKEHPEEARKKGISSQLANEYTQGMTSSRFKRLRDRVRAKSK